MGHRIGQYEVLNEVGSGGMGVVYRAMDVMLEREVALKRLRPELSTNPGLIARFRREAQTQARLSHTNINQLYTLVQDGDALCIVMEFVNGADLSAYIPCSWQIALPLVLQTLAGIGYAHQRGVLHRDIKPENIFVDTSGNIKVMDFGIAHTLGTARMTVHKGIIGTLEYMAPERVRGDEADQRSDIYSMGILLFQMIAGRVPFQSTNEYELLRAHLEYQPPQLSDFAPGLPAFVVSAVEKALAKNPDDRFGSCDEMAAFLSQGAANAGLRLNTALMMAPAAGPAVPTPARETSAGLDRSRRRIESMISAGSLDVAQKLIDDALRDFPDQPEILALRDRLSVAEGARPTVVADIAVRKDPRSVVQDALAKALLEDKERKSAEALRTIDQALSEYGDIPALLVARAYLRTSRSSQDGVSD